MVNPILDGAWGIAEQPGNLRARHALRYEKHTVEPVVIARLLRPLNFLLQTQHRSGTGYRERSHDSSKPQFNSMRNYL